jgi:hypothetical protein
MKTYGADGSITPRSLNLGARFGLVVGFGFPPGRCITGKES